VGYLDLSVALLDGGLVVWFGVVGCIGGQKTLNWRAGSVPAWFALAALPFVGPLRQPLRN
jgi:hypothetical protein